jgi:hypothetical protein
MKSTVAVELIDLKLDFKKHLNTALCGFCDS